jgi:hypothetical protein
MLETLHVRQSAATFRRSLGHTRRPSGQVNGTAYVLEVSTPHPLELASGQHNGIGNRLSDEGNDHLEVHKRYRIAWRQSQTDRGLGLNVGRCGPIDHW